MPSSPWTPPQPEAPAVADADGDVVPVLDIWWRPGPTMRFFVQNRRAPWLIPIAMVHGIVRWDFAKEFPIDVQIGANLLLGAVAGVVVVLLGSLWFWLVGRLLEGRGTYIEVATAMVWGRLPQTAVLFVVLLVNLVRPTYGELEVFVGGGLRLFVLIGMFWATVWQVIMVAEAHRFGYLQALVTVFSLSLLVVFGFLTLVAAFTVLL